MLLADGTVPKPVYFDSYSGGFGWEVTHWSVYDGQDPYTPRPQAHSLRGECSCGWTGTPRPLDPASTAADDDDGRAFREAGMEHAEDCRTDWNAHIVTVTESTIPLPAELDALLETLSSQLEDLADTSPVAALKAARALEVMARQSAYWPARDAQRLDRAEVAAGLGLNEAAAGELLERWVSGRR
ncbi:hypothetical protein O1L60_39350 [Streptomyces diastatochromogenes]|nr:hypothetical protein [Streptomyces diastatochromogenes]